MNSIDLDFSEANHAETVTLANGSRIDVLGPDACHKWLGRMLSTHAQNPFSHDLEARLSTANRAFFKHRHLLCCRSIPVEMRVRLFQALVSPVACYASGCKPLTLTDANRFHVAYRRYLRQVVGFPKLLDRDLPWHEMLHHVHSKIKEITSKCGTKPWSEQAAQATWCWAGKVCRMAPDRWPRHMLVVMEPYWRLGMEEWSAARTRS